MTTRITVSLPDDAVSAARKAVKRGEAASVSAYVAHALSHTYGTNNRTRELRPIADLLAELSAEFGEPSAAAYRWADDVLGLG